jgi:hypothetical protein
MFRDNVSTSSPRVSITTRWKPEITRFTFINETHTHRRVYIFFIDRYNYMLWLIIYLSSGCTCKQIRNNITALNFLLIFLCVQPKLVAVFTYIVYSLVCCVFKWTSGRINGRYFLYFFLEF